MNHFPINDNEVVNAHIQKQRTNAHQFRLMKKASVKQDTSPNTVDRAKFQYRLMARGIGTITLAIIIIGVAFVLQSILL